MPLLTIDQLNARIRTERQARDLADWLSNTIAWRKADIRLELLEELRVQMTQGATGLPCAANRSTPPPPGAPGDGR